ncbi:MAG TPA: HD domain-containing protein, partial [Ignavibacteriaceae bacterium]|nr:HD domain-containing protein [Ignavibacteriaceae bacterium]
MTGIRIIKNVEEYIKGLYNKHSSELLCYHNLEHAKEVVEVITELCDVMNISEIERENLIIAGWFHDVGYFETCSGHEELSAEYADRYLSEQNFPGDRIKRIRTNILATKVPTNPANI